MSVKNSCFSLSFSQNSCVCRNFVLPERPSHMWDEKEKVSGCCGEDAAGKRNHPPKFEGQNSASRVIIALLFLGWIISSSQGSFYSRFFRTFWCDDSAVAIASVIQQWIEAGQNICCFPLLDWYYSGLFLTSQRWKMVHQLRKKNCSKFFSEIPKKLATR